MKTRTYIAYTDDGHDYGEFCFSSCHRKTVKQIWRMQKEKQAENMASVLNTSKLSVLREI
jgi:hypothetical protein